MSKGKHFKLVPKLILEEHTDPPDKNHFRVVLDILTQYLFLSNAVIIIVPFTLNGGDANGLYKVL